MDSSYLERFLVSFFRTLYPSYSSNHLPTSPPPPSSSSLPLFQAANEIGWKTDTLYKSLAVLALVAFVLVAIPYTIRAALYPRKVLKEWNNPVTGNYFSAIPITITLGGLLFLPTSADSGLVLIWIGAILQMAIAVLIIADRVYLPVSEETLNPSLLMAPVGCFACALAFVKYASYSSHLGPNSTTVLYIARLWFAVAAFFGLMFFILTFRKAMLDHHSDVRVRVTLWVWLATTSIAGPAYAATSGGIGKCLLFCVCLVYYCCKHQEMISKKTLNCIACSVLLCSFFL
jgi:tellurite resistance protein TehA-like permease